MALAIGVLLVGEAIHPLWYVAILLMLLGVAVLHFGSRWGRAESSLVPEADQQRT